MRSLKMNELNKKEMIRSYNNLIHSNMLKVLETQEADKYRELLMLEDNTRHARNLWKKTWKRLRLYDGPWRFNKKLN